MDKTIILKSLNDAILKCKVDRVGILGLNNQIKHSLNQFRENVKDYTYETSTWISENGEVVYKKDGEAHVVYINNEDYVYIGSRGLSDLIFTHNHPGGLVDGDYPNYTTTKIPTMLSKDDTKLLLKESYAIINEKIIQTNPFRGIVAEASNGSRTSLIRKKNILVEEVNKEEYLKTYDLLHTKWSNFITDYNNAVQNHMMEWVNDKEEMESNWSFNDYMTESFRFGKKYADSNFRNDLNEIIDKFDELGFELSLEWK